VTRLHWLYPPAWRRRYGAELAALVEELGPSPRVVADALLGALRAHLEPPPPAVPPAPSPLPAPVEVRPPAEPPPRPLARTRPDQWESVMDQIVREARERGVFDNLAGAGRPLPVDDNPFAGERDLAFRFIRQAGETLPWIALGREIEAEREKLDADLAATARRLASGDGAERSWARTEARERYLARAAALDGKIGAHARQVPHPRFEKPRISPATAARSFDRSCPE
jgi:DnaJ family protein C protein 28